jgi:hypothetical protein
MRYPTQFVFATDSDDERIKADLTPLAQRRMPENALTSRFQENLEIAGILNRPS